MLTWTPGCPRSGPCMRPGRYVNRLKLIQELTNKCKLNDLSFDAFVRALFASRRELAAAVPLGGA